MATQAPPKGQAQGQQAPTMPAQPFRVGVYSTELPDYDRQVTMATGTVRFPNYTITPTGWLRGIWFDFTCTTAANAATVAFTADGPFAAISSFTFKDVGNREVFGPITGYDWLTIMKFGGYHEIGDPRSGGVSGAGRDHWTHCLTDVFAGGGIRGGQTYGASDRFAEYPASKPVTPADITKTVYRAMGIHDLEARDQQNRPYNLLAEGNAIGELF